MIGCDVCEVLFQVLLRIRELNFKKEIVSFARICTELKEFKSTDVSGALADLVGRLEFVRVSYGDVEGYRIYELTSLGLHYLGLWEKEKTFAARYERGKL